MKGRKRSPESCARISEARRSWAMTAEHKAKVVAALRRRKFTPEQRDAIAKRMKGNRYGALIRRDEAWSANLSRVLSGENGGGAKFTNAQAAKIRQLHASGVLQVEIARRFGVSNVDIHRIVRFKTYKYAP